MRILKIIIILLFFQLHGAWAEEIEQNEPEEIMELFGIKFGDKCIDSRSDSYRTKVTVQNT